MKTLFLLSHTPIPRFTKRISIASKRNATKLIYWDRKIKNDVKFTLPDNVECENIKIRAPQGEPLKRLLLLFSFSIRSLKKINVYKPKNLHVGNFDMLLIAYFYKVFKNRKLNIIYEIGDLPNLCFKKGVISRAYRRLEKRLLKKVDYLVLTSPYFWDEHYKFLTQESKYYFIPNVPSTKMLKYGPKNNLFANRNLTIGFIGSVRFEEQLKMLIDCLKAETDINILIAGTGKNLDSLKQYAGSHKNIQFTGAYDYKEISRLYSAVDIVYSVYDSQRRNAKIALPNRLYEAIFFAKPIIVSQSTELAKFVLSKGVGYVVSDRNPKELQELISYVKNSETNLEKKRKNCIAITPQYIYENYISTIKSFYH